MLNISERSGSGREIAISGAFTNEFAGMTEQRVSLDTLHEVRQRLFRELPALLTEQQRSFLLGLVRGQPDWQLMSCPHLAEISAIKWKLANLQQLKKRNPAKFHAQSELLAEGFSNIGD